MSGRTPPIQADEPVTVRSVSEGETVAAGERLGRALVGEDVVAISGPLGAGKTRFVRGVCRALGTDRDASSPTFTMSTSTPRRGSPCSTSISTGSPRPPS